MFYILFIILTAVVGVIIGLAAAGKIPKGTAAIAASIIGAFIIMLGAVRFMDYYEYKEPIPDTISTESHDTKVYTDTEATAYITDSAKADATEADATETTAAYADTTSAVPVTESAAVTTDAKETKAMPQTETAVKEAPKVPENSVSDSADSSTDTEPMDTEPADTEAPETAAPDYAALAEDAYLQTVQSAVAYVGISPRGNSFESYPFEREDTYSPLSDTQKKYYDELLLAAESFEAPVYHAEDGHVMSDVRAAADALFTARPDIKCYFALEEECFNEELISLKAKYFLPSDGTDVTYSDKSGILSDMAYLDAVGDFIVGFIPDWMTTYDKYRYLASVISLTTEYDMDYEHSYNNATAYGGIIGGKTICIGYSVGFEYLCAKADLYCARVEGISFADNIHMWNLARLSDGTYYIDVTWSDNGVNKPCSSGWMKYFMITQEELLKDHIISDGTVATGT